MMQDSIQLTVSYYEHTSDMFALETEITNNTDRIIRVGPNSFKYKAYNGYPPENPGNIITSNQAEDPEQKILNLDLALSRQESEPTNRRVYVFLPCRD